MGKVLVTGGAGFIGSHLIRALLEAGRSVRVLDALDGQVHERIPELTDEVEFIKGDVADPDACDRALDGATEVVHFAAAVGVGQSMYEIVHYCRANVMGTATLLERMRARTADIHRLLVASSMSIYGEGLYWCSRCDAERIVERSLNDLARARWEPACPECAAGLRPRPTLETKPVVPRSVYAVNKRHQEDMCLCVGRAYGIPTVALRFFNVYGPGQALSNPYTGVAAIFASRLLAGQAPLVFEDGAQSRDFIHVSDVAAACMAALTRPDVDQLVANVGTGQSVSVAEVAGLLGKELGGPAPVFLGTYREGDIRHCFADIGRANERLGWQPQIPLEEGISDLVAWVQTQLGYGDRVDGAMAELHRHGLVK